MKQALTLSIVIPAYNEESHLKACLDSIAVQSVAPDEVIVVNNNSTDKTLEVAKQYSFVKVMHEKEQGLIPARNLGFNNSHSDILARINADVVLSPDWVKFAKKNFQQHDIAGITGPAVAKTVPYFSSLRSIFWSRVYLMATNAFFRVKIMWGANMAIRKDIWEQIKTDASNEDRFVHEDQDLSLLIAGLGGLIKYDPNLIVSTNEQSYQYWPKLKEYSIRRWKTKALHYRRGTLRSEYARVLPLWRTLPILVIVTIPAWLFIVTSFVSYPFTNLYRYLQSRRG